MKREDTVRRRGWGRCQCDTEQVEGGDEAAGMEGGGSDEGTGGRQQWAKKVE